MSLYDKLNDDPRVQNCFPKFIAVVDRKHVVLAEVVSGQVYLTHEGEAFMADAAPTPVRSSMSCVLDIGMARPQYGSGRLGPPTPGQSRAKRGTPIRPRIAQRPGTSTRTLARGSPGSVRSTASARWPRTASRCNSAVCPKAGLPFAAAARNCSWSRVEPCRVQASTSGSPASRASSMPTSVCTISVTAASAASAGSGRAAAPRRNRVKTRCR